MLRYEGEWEPQYRKKSYFDGNDTKYIIEKRKGNKWVFCFGGMDYKEAKYYIDHPSLIESQMKTFRITGYFVIAFTILFIVYFLIYN